MSTSDELRNALNRRLQKMDSGNGTTRVRQSTVSPDLESNPSSTDVQNVYRSGWSSTAHLERSTMLPPAPGEIPKPLKSSGVDYKSSTNSINLGIVDQRKSEITKSMRSDADSSSVGGPLSSGGSSIVLNVVRRTSGAKLDVSSEKVSANVVISKADNGKVILEGYLYKFSSGTLTSRWQKRYFVLREGELAYFSSHEAAMGSSANTPIVGPNHIPGESTQSGINACVRFPVKRILSVGPRGDREIDLHLGRASNKPPVGKSGTTIASAGISPSTGGQPLGTPQSSELPLSNRKYLLKATSPEVAAKWVSSIQVVISQHSLDQSKYNGSAEGSVFSENSGSLPGDDLSYTSSMGNGPLSIAKPPSQQTPDEPLWEQQLISNDELDALFSDWFSFLDHSNLSSWPKAGRIIDAGSRAVSDMWSVLGSLPRGEDVRFDDVKGKLLKSIKEKCKPGGGSPRGCSSQHPPEDQPLSIVEQYLIRLCKHFQIWGSNVKSVEDIPVVVEWSTRLGLQLDELFGNASISRVGQISDNHSSAKYKSIWNSAIHKLANDWEVCLIERIKRCLNSMPGNTQNVLIAPEIYSNSLLGSPAGSPQKQQHAILVGAWLGSYMGTLIELCVGHRGKSSGAANWSITYPTCHSVLLAHAANALIASLNSCWREFQSKANLYAIHRKKKTMSKVVDNVKNRLSSRRKSNAGGLDSPPRRGDSSFVEPPEGEFEAEKVVSALTSGACTIEEMVAFGNECTVVSVFCQHASGLSEICKASPVFSTCMEGLSLAFANTSSDVSKSLVKTRFGTLKVLHQSFDPKHLSVRLKVPISDSVDAANGFLRDVSFIGVHELFKYLMVGHVMQTVASSYVDSLLYHKPKISKFSRLAAVIAEDEALFFSAFKELGRPVTELNKAIDGIGHIRQVLSDRAYSEVTEKSGGASGSPTLTAVNPVVIQHSAEITKAFPALDKASEVIKALLEMKGFSKHERRDILDAVSEMAQKEIHTLSP